MGQFQNSFKYDVILSLNSSLALREHFPLIAEKFQGQKILAATFNHRFFNLQEKNFMKGFIEAHNLDHLMFSMRPSSKDLVSKGSEFEIGKFREVSQVLFVLQVMARYDITKAVLDVNYLTMQNGVSKVKDVVVEIRTFLDELTQKFSPAVNVRKQFCIFFKFEDVLSKIQDYELITARSFESVHSQVNSFQYDDNQISELEKDLFWVGFDPSYKEVPQNKEYPQTKWTDLISQSEFGRGLYEKKLKYCARCCHPETMEGMSFDGAGICVPCRSSEMKMHMNWEKRRLSFDAMINSFRSDNYYDCMLPMSGGKDSAYQAYILTKVLEVTPLAVTHGQNWYTLAGRYNLENCLQKFDLDHIIFHMNRSVINKMARKSIDAIGDACWHCHIGAGSFTVQSALAWDVSLMIWGESIAENDGRGSYDSQSEVSLLYNLDVSAKVKAEDMADEKTSQADLSAWIYPPTEVLSKSKVKYIHLGDYFFWDEERQVEFVKRNFEWMDAPVENTYKGYKSVECVMAGVHDYSNFIKRGVGRATMHAAEDIRRGILTREEGVELAKQYDTQRPHALDFYLKLTGLTENEFEKACVDARSKSENAERLNKV